MPYQAEEALPVATLCADDPYAKAPRDDEEAERLMGASASSDDSDDDFDAHRSASALGTLSYLYGLLVVAARV